MKFKNNGINIKNYLKTSVVSFLFLTLSFQSQASILGLCTDLLNGRTDEILRDVPEKESTRILPRSEVTSQELSDYAAKNISHIPEFQYIRQTAQEMGLRVWLFGGTASSFLHYTKWDLLRQKGLMDLQKDRFDYDFTNIFRSTQDLDIVVDAKPEVANRFGSLLSQKFPHFLGSKANKWEVRTLKARMGTPGQPGFKEALLNDSDFNNQDTDSNSIGMVEITSSQDPVVTDLKHWGQSESVFLKDAVNNQITFFRNPKHFTTSRAKIGENPEILSVTRLLVKALQYELDFSKNDFDQIKEIVREFNPRQVNNAAAVRRITDTAKKLIMHAVNIEYAVNKLDELGLRQKLIQMGDKSQVGNFAWWLNREPLRSQTVGQGRGKTAHELNIQVVAHETNSFLAYESITRSHSGEPNVLISRQNGVGEAAAYGDGFYTRLGKVGARGTGLTIRFTVDPNAREGTDFISHGDYIVFKNKRALKVIQESLNFTLDDLVQMAESNQEVQVDHSDLALIEKLKRKMNAAIITDELEKLLNSPLETDHDRLVHILSAFQSSSVSKLISQDVLASVVKNIYSRVAIMAQSINEADILKYIRTVGPIIKTVESLGFLSHQSFLKFLVEIKSNSSISFNLRKEALFEILLNSQEFESQLNFKRDVTGEELQHLISEIRGWDKSQDPRKRQFAAELDARWTKAIENGDIKKIEALIDSSLFDLNYKNVSGFSILLLADYYDQKKIIDWLFQNSDYDFNQRNSLGLTQVEQLKLLGKDKLADEIQRSRSESESRPIKVKERNSDGSPIIDFVRIEPASFMMGEDEKNKVITTITKSFELASIPTTQIQWLEVVDLLKKYRGGEYNSLNRDPSHFRGLINPVEKISYDDIMLWTKGLNELSQMDDIQIQNHLTSLFPGHKKDAQYGLPTEAQWELVARNGGLAQGQYSFGNSEKNLKDYAVFSENSGNKTSPVGQKKPVFYNGKPIYDMHGLVWEWVADQWDGQSPLKGGRDPISTTGSLRVLRGGSWFLNAQYLRSAFRNGYSPAGRYYNVGFRLLRTPK